MLSPQKHVQLFGVLFIVSTQPNLLQNFGNIDIWGGREWYNLVKGLINSSTYDITLVVWHMGRKMILFSCFVFYSGDIFGLTLKRL